MKIYKFGIIALVIGLWGCTADHEPEETRGSGRTVSLTLDINVSGSGETRGNDDFAHGEDSEFAVSEACVALFAGSGEDDAEFEGAFRLVGDSEPGQEADVTVSSVHRMRARVPAEVAKSDKQLYALAFVNYSGVMTLNDTDGSLDFKGDGTFKPYTGRKASEMMKVRVTNAAGRMMVNGRFFMTNAPMSDRPGGNTRPGNAKVTTLARIDMEKIPDPDEPCCYIFVERGLAKINVRLNPQILNDKLIVPGPDGSVKYLTLENIEWWLDDPHCTGYVGENGSAPYLVRNVEGVSDYINYSVGSGDYRYRFVGKTPLADYNGNNKAYRVNWAIDPDYDTDVENSGYKTPHRYRIKWNKPGRGDERGDVVYAPENTFDVGHMNYRNSPRIIVRVKYSMEGNSLGDGTLFRVNGNEKSLYSIDDMTNLAVTIVERNARYKEWSKSHAYNRVNYFTYTYFGISELISDQAVTSYGDVFTATYNDPTARLTSMYGLKYDSNNQLIADPELSRNTDMAKYLTELIDRTISIKAYPSGYAYYEIRLKHFGDEYTPAGDAGYGQVTADEAYGGDNVKYLGRYGMVRNNWYDVYINSIEDLGEPHIPESTLPDDPRYNYPDDYEPAYMGVQINLMPWTRRDQHLKF